MSPLAGLGRAELSRTVSDTQFISELRELICDIRTIQELLALSRESEELAAAYIDYSAISGACMRTRCTSLLQTVSRVEVLVSWNFKHIVNLKRIRVVSRQRVG